MLSAVRINIRLLTLSLLFAALGGQLEATAQGVSGTPQAGFAPVAQPTRPLSPHEAEIAADTETLYRLTRELKLELEKSGTGTLSSPMVQKTAEIEKLAHRLNEEMKKK